MIEVVFVSTVCVLSETEVRTRLRLTTVQRSISPG